MALADDIDRLSRTRPFNLLPREAIQLIAFSAEKRVLAANESLFSEGDPADCGYFVLSGSILLTARAHAGERARVAQRGDADRRECDDRRDCQASRARGRGKTPSSCASRVRYFIAFWESFPRKRRASEPIWRRERGKFRANWKSCARGRSIRLAERGPPRGAYLTTPCSVASTGCLTIWGAWTPDDPVRRSLARPSFPRAARARRSGRPRPGTSSRRPATRQTDGGPCPERRCRQQTASAGSSSKYSASIIVASLKCYIVSRLRSEKAPRRTPARFSQNIDRPAIAAPWSTVNAAAPQRFRI